jgi:multidrug efflux system membrane fusion protein
MGKVGFVVLMVVSLGAGGWWWWREVVARNQTAAAIDKAGGGTTAAPGSAGAGRKRGARTAMTSVTVAKVAQEDFEEWLTMPGTVAALQVVTVRSRVDGELHRVNFEEGQAVKAGDLLAEIDPRPFEAELERKRGERTRNEAILRNAKANLARTQELLKGKLVPQQEADTQSALVQQFEGALAAADAEIASAELQLSYTKIISPISGRTGLRRMDQGNMVRAASSEGLVTITQEDPAGLLFSIPQDRAAAVRRKLAAGEQVTVQVSHSDMGAVLAEGRVLATENQVDVASGTLRIKAEVPNPDGVLIPSQFVMVRLLVNTVRGATVAPAGAVQRGAQGAYAYVVNEDATVSLRQLKTGLMSGDRVEVLEGLQPGETVAVQGVDRLRDGAAVRVVRSEPAVAGPP